MAANNNGALQSETQTFKCERQVIVKCDLNNFTLQQFEDLVLKKELKMVEPEVNFNDALVISGNGDGKLNGTKTLSEMEFRDGSTFSAVDTDLNHRIFIVLCHAEKLKDNDREFVIKHLKDIKVERKAEYGVLQWYPCFQEE